LGLLKRKEFWKTRGLFRHRVLGKIKKSYRYLLVDNHRFNFDKLQILLVVLGFFPTKHGILLYFDSYFIVIQKCKNLYMNVMFMLLCELFVPSKYDEMNCDFVSRVFDNVFLKANSS
jgi:hypothetical protein